ncbi:hypothetical protein B7494_g1051 [Chlorociboria aeruginascens]|nr:hypothetical protein B7494_g1051 [Chlorociboria aeruginascens]
MDDFEAIALKYIMKHLDDPPLGDDDSISVIDSASMSCTSPSPSLVSCTDLTLSPVPVIDPTLFDVPYIDLTLSPSPVIDPTLFDVPHIDLTLSTVQSIGGSIITPTIEAGPIPATMFIRFRNLPEEVRLKIWSFSMPGPRIVEVTVTEKRGRFIDNNPPIPNFRVCQESRREALKTHTFSFSVDWDTRYIPFNFKTDTLYLGPGLNWDYEKFRHQCAEHELEKVQKLMVDKDIEWSATRPCLAFMSILVFKGLKEYTCVNSAMVPRRIDDRLDVIHLERIQLDERECSLRRNGIKINCIDYHQFGLRKWNVPQIFTFEIEKEPWMSWSEYTTNTMQKAVEVIFDNCWELEFTK